MRVVGFRDGQRKKLASFMEKSESVSLKNCQIRRARQAEELEVVLRSSSGVESSPKKFTVGDIGRLVNSKMKLKDLNSRNTFDKVCVETKVVRVDESVKVAGGISKQDVVIADSTLVAKITLWERDIGSVVEGSLTALVRLWCVAISIWKYLSAPKEGALIMEIEDVGEVVEDDLAEDSVTVDSTEVIGVMTLDSYSACLACNSKVEPSGSEMGCCSKCKMQQCISCCKKHLNAKLMISAGSSYLTLNVFGSNVCVILHRGKMLLLSPFFLLLLFT